MLLAKNWWSLTLRGVLAVIFGLLTFAWPVITVHVLVIMFGIYAFIDGVLNLAGAWRRSQQQRRWGAVLFEGIAGILAGLVAMVWPAITVIVLLGVIGIWAIITGVLEILAAIRLRKHITGEWILALSGVASIVFGVLLFAAPLAGALVIALWFGAYALLFGVLMIVLSFRLRGWHRLNGPGEAVRV